MNGCIFCSIASDSSKLIWENEAAVAFRDINPKAPVHILVVPKAHIQSLDELHDDALAGQILLAAQSVALQEKIAGAYRVHINTGEAAGQVVPHLHLHVLGGFTSPHELESLREAGL